MIYYRPLYSNGTASSNAITIDSTASYDNEYYTISSIKFDIPKEKEHFSKENFEI